MLLPSIVAMVETNLFWKMQFGRIAGKIDLTKRYYKAGHFAILFCLSRFHAPVNVSDAHSRSSELQDLYTVLYQGYCTKGTVETE